MGAPFYGGRGAWGAAPFTMKLKQIKTFGFKTFAEPTTMEFGGGITAVVGPNGSGKSNLIDAFRWVLGEQSSKSLRSGKMEDVIFAGNEKRKPLGLAEVSLTFDNSDRRLPIDFTEVEITRRAYRAGEIEYYINRNQCRLRDILDLLMGTGLGPGSYSIVSQGQIDSILTSKPTDRRALFEETAGINKFLARKNESMRRLEQTEQNAIRINDLIAELERRIPELDTQVRRAKRYRKLSARVRDLEILSYIRASASRRSERETLKAELDRNEEVRSAAAAKAASLGAQLAQARTRVYKHELQVEELRTQSQSLRAELARLEADYAAALARRETLEAQSTQTSEDAARVQHERETLEAAVADLESRIAPLAQDLESAREAELQAQSALSGARGELDAIFTRLREVEAAASAVAARKAERRVQGENARAEAERLEREAANARARAEQLEIACGAATHKFAERERDLAQLETQLVEARGRFEDAERGVAPTQGDLSHAITAHREYASEVAAAQSRLHTIEELENSMEGHVPGTRAVIEAAKRGEMRGIDGVVSNLITTDEQYARAMDVAFGARLSNIITRTSEDAERAIDYLNAKESGRATFLPLDTLQNRTGKELTPDLRDVRGVIGYAHTLIRTQPHYDSIVKFLVGNVLVVDTLQTGIFLVRSRGLRDTIVTLSGEQITGGGAITGGRYQREKSILSRRVQAQTLREQTGRNASAACALGKGGARNHSRGPGGGRPARRSGAGFAPRGSRAHGSARRNGGRYRASRTHAARVGRCAKRFKRIGCIRRASPRARTRSGKRETRRGAQRRRPAAPRERSCGCAPPYRFGGVSAGASERAWRGSARAVCCAYSRARRREGAPRNHRSGPGTRPRRARTHGRRNLRLAGTARAGFRTVGVAARAGVAGGRRL